MGAVEVFFAQIYKTISHLMSIWGLVTKIHPLFELGLCAVADVLAGFGRRGTPETRHYGDILFEK